ncbi:YdbL family protein [Oceanobacter kriegii]|uniref:YdbL family protein n=1 Tax=Oceanobacter kriegii TaxID=64972 RepID=UPI0003F8C7AD|nr:YdbL family protein [Oceanobacter kriegii]
MKTLMTFCALMLMSLGAAAMDLDTARETGLVGERLDGYVGVVNASGPVDALVAEINQQRKQHYQQIANKQNTPLANIEKIAGEKLVGKAKQQGYFYQSANGEWAQD